MLNTIKRPPYSSIPLEAGLKLRGGNGFRFEEKMDGEWAVKETHCSTIIGEEMRDGRFFAFDIISWMGIDVRGNPLCQRIKLLDQLAIGPEYGLTWCEPPTFLRPAVGTGGEFLEAVLARGGEGIVIKDLDAPYGAEWIKCKRVETWDLIVVEKAAGKSSVRLANAQGEDFGWCPCRAAYDTLNIGDIVEIAAYGRHSSGKLREPRFVGVRGDKMKGNL